jgi:ElaA protein
MHFRCIPFAALSLPQLYAILQLRAEVFIVEQNCPYLDLDNRDAAAHHLLCYDTVQTNEGATTQLVAYCRLLPPHLAYAELPDISIGRVVSSPLVRGTGVGQRLMQEALRRLPTLFADEYGRMPVCRIGAQAYLQEFYEGFGFVATGKKYLEDGIPHIEMVANFSK